MIMIAQMTIQTTESTKIILVASTSIGLTLILTCSTLQALLTQVLQTPPLKQMRTRGMMMGTQTQAGRIPITPNSQQILTAEAEQEQIALVPTKTDNGTTTMTYPYLPVQQSMVSR